MTRSLSRRRLLRTGTAAALGLSLPLRHPSAATTSKGGILKVAADTEPRNLNPAIVASNGVFFVASKVVEPLAEQAFAPNGAPIGQVPRLATGWEGAPDGRSVRLTLRQGVTWHDGQPFDSRDVAFTALEVWRKLQNLGQVVFASLEAVDTPDAATAILRFAQPVPFQLFRNAMPALTSVLPRHLYEGGDIMTNPANKQPVGTGPFRFVEHKEGDYYRLERHVGYWQQDQPYLDGILYRVLPDKGAIAAALETGDIDVAAFSAVSLADIDRLTQQEGMQVDQEGYEALTYQVMIEINHRRKELADVRVRRAIAFAVDRKQVADTIFMGRATPATGPVPRSDAQFFEESVPHYAFDPAMAERMLDEAGYPRGADGKRFSLSLLPAPWFEQTLQMGDYLKQALARIGIEAIITVLDPAAHQQAVYTDHRFDLAIGSPAYRNDPGISTTILYKSGIPAGVPFSNQYGYADTLMDNIIAQAAAATDPIMRITVFQRFQKYAGLQLPIIPVVDFTMLTTARPNVRGIAANPRWAVSNWADTWLA
ncbi:peptide/nickel transport system substrate-binding protein [Arboricoccus pini]|uniref:Peptide/nickel transport system substrate-binding protein n=1 Tax=Arboricoccus pini TaxID=1963835 RepID=A0A212QMT4_9PROT|nr:ABC transporter substrate-binding protein [Arboricoccus pini]SNB60703.1 peptide/nickel transport system substrate-binding protein [Arboricoccus pini]